ncbi:nucleoside 2-deoxyribosyltransferase [Mesorhizobium neociceri]|uniref:Nucleoside 2-deoxyribosyltransferase n=1 Tax=Mesorhizobium neociceri TaxID=1307853 RepID=A0A838BD24_9HYPH|nr:nucleoside 2-deoxyribosyltransferase [Mesorhizobium neociceri]MBA1143464.1 nucleoside 2-deoxyribosyltransferase [Mesorhizobium neociceri]
MPGTILIGEVTVDFTMPTRATDAKVRLGGVVHAARGLWASGQDYAVGAFCPAYLVEQAQNYLTQHGCRDFVLLGEVTGAPNVIAIADVREVGHQGYEDILRGERKIVLSGDHIDLKRFDTIVIFPGSYDLEGVINQLRPGARVTIDAAYDVDGADTLSSLTGRIDSIVISTSSDLFAKLASSEITPLLDLAKSVGAKHLLLKENRGGSRLFDLGTDRIEYITATLDVTTNSVGVGDVFTAVFGSFDGSARDAAWRGMQVATVYSQTTWPDDLQRDVKRELRMPVEVVRELGGVTLPWHARPGLQIYLAAPDFSYKDHKEISAAVAALEYHNFRVRRPVKENGEADREAPVESLSSYYFNDVQLLRECAAVFAIPIERDPGTLVEIGLAIEMGKPVVTFDPREENRNTMVIMGSAAYSFDLDVCLNGMFDTLSKLQRDDTRK